ncbi:MAG: GNAT family N-acetyltransferase [Pelobium sp.]
MADGGSALVSVRYDKNAALIPFMNKLANRCQPLQQIEMNIRLSSNNTAQQIFEVFKNCKQTMELENIFQWNESYPNFNNILEDINNEQLYEIFCDNNIIGVICINNKQEPEYKKIDWSDKNGKALIIHRLAVNPLFQNKGFATKLMTFAENYASNSDFTSIRLDAYSGNEKALKLYERRGYDRKGQIAFSGRSLPFFCFEKVIKK